MLKSKPLLLSQCMKPSLPQSLTASEYVESAKTVGLRRSNPCEAPTLSQTTWNPAYTKLNPRASALDPENGCPVERFVFFLGGGRC